MNNFSYLNQYPAFGSFAPAAIAAEQILSIDCAASALNCRRAMESAIKWMYAVDDSLKDPGDDTLITLMNQSDFKDMVGTDIFRRMDYIRRIGNQAAHDGTPVTRGMALLCLENLFVFLDFIAFCYAGDSGSHIFDASLVSVYQSESSAELTDTDTNVQDMSALIEENQALREQLTATRAEKRPDYTPHPLKLSEYQTRKLYVDAMLTDAGWIEGKDWEDEHYIGRLPDGTTDAMIDYVLWGSDKKPLALIEARRTAEQVGQGRKRAKLCADMLEQQYGRRPVIFLTNGFETHIIDNEYPERTVSGIWSKSDLTRLLDIRKKCRPLKNVSVEKSIAGRNYQISAVRAMCSALFAQKRRRIILSMAPGAGKTRTVFALCDVLKRYDRARSVLFLSDRDTLVTQAAKVMKEVLPGISQANVSAGSHNYTAKYLFATYSDMCGIIDTAFTVSGRSFTAGHFDLIICDEVHGTLFDRYRDMLNYFDAPMIGMTSTPADEIDKKTYTFFDLKKCVPTYSYSIEQAVKDGFLVDYVVRETDDDLSDRLFDEQAIRHVLDTLMTDGQKVNVNRSRGKICGEVPGKTILFAANREHAELIADVFARTYPALDGLCAVIDSTAADAQSRIERFAKPDSLPMIAVSAEALDEGVDIPSVLNLVFFRPVKSKAHFWQMIGRGTRLCPGLLGGKDKTSFYVFDWCGNFDAFRMTGGRHTIRLTWAGAVFRQEMKLAVRLMEKDCETKDLQTLRASVVTDMTDAVRALDRDSFSVRQHLLSVEKCADASGYAALTKEEADVLTADVAPLFTADPVMLAADRFDALMFRLMCAKLDNEKDDRAASTAAEAVSGLPDCPDAAALLSASPTALNEIRDRLRGLIRRRTDDEETDRTMDRELLTMEITE